MKKTTELKATGVTALSVLVAGAASLLGSMIGASVLVVLLSGGVVFALMQTVVDAAGLTVVATTSASYAAAPAYVGLYDDEATEGERVVFEQVHGWRKL